MIICTDFTCVFKVADQIITHQNILTTDKHNLLIFGSVCSYFPACGIVSVHDPVQGVSTVTNMCQVVSPYT